MAPKTVPPVIPLLMDPEAAKLIKRGDLNAAAQRVAQATGMSVDDARALVQDIRSTKPWVALRAMGRLVSASAKAASSGASAAQAPQPAHKPHAPQTLPSAQTPDFSHTHRAHVARRAKGLSPGEMPRGGDGAGKWVVLLAIGAIAVMVALHLR